MRHVDVVLLQGDVPPKGYHNYMLPACYTSAAISSLQQVLRFAGEHNSSPMTQRKLIQPVLSETGRYTWRRRIVNCIQMNGQRDHKPNSCWRFLTVSTLILIFWVRTVSWKFEWLWRIQTILIGRVDVLWCVDLLAYYLLFPSVLLRYGQFTHSEVPRRPAEKHLKCSFTLILHERYHLPPRTFIRLLTRKLLAVKYTDQRLSSGINIRWKL